jgi:hypothetical protein
VEVKDFLDTVGAVIGSDLLINVLFFIECVCYFLANRHLLIIWLGQVTQIIGHDEGILERPHPHVAGVCELWVVLVHICDGAWSLIESWQSEVTLFEYILLIELGNRDHVGSLPSVVHNGRKSCLVCSFSGAIG